MFTIAENVAHNLCNSNNTATSIGIIRVTMYAANAKVSHIHRRMCQWDYTEWVTRSSVSKAKEGGHVRIGVNFRRDRQPKIL